VSNALVCSGAKFNAQRTFAARRLPKAQLPSESRLVF